MSHVIDAQCLSIGYNHGPPTHDSTQMNKNHVPVTQTSTGYDPGPSIHVNHPISDNDPGPPIHASIQTITSHVPDTRGPPIPVNIQTITIEDVQPLSANEF